MQLPGTAEANQQANDRTPVEGAVNERRMSQSAAVESKLESKLLIGQTVIPPTAEKPPDRLAGAKDVTDILSKVLPLMAGTIYVFGYFITARRLAAYGASVTHLLDAQYLTAGLPLGLLFWLTLVVVYLACQYDPRRNTGKLRDWMGWIVLGGFVLLLVTGLLTAVLNKTHGLGQLLTQKWFKLYLSTLFKTALAEAALWYLIVAFLTGWFADLVKLLRSHGRGSDAVEIFQIPLILIGIVIFGIIDGSSLAISVYDELPQSYGGGRPVTAQLYVEREKTPVELLSARNNKLEKVAAGNRPEKIAGDAAPDKAGTVANGLAYTVPLEVVFRTSDTFLVALEIEGRRRVWALDAESVRAVLFATESPQVNARDSEIPDGIPPQFPREQE